MTFLYTFGRPWHVVTLELYEWPARQYPMDPIDSRLTRWLPGELWGSQQPMVTTGGPAAPKFGLQTRDFHVSIHPFYIRQTVEPLEGQA